MKREVATALHDLAEVNKIAFAPAWLAKVFASRCAERGVVLTADLEVALREMFQAVADTREMVGLSVAANEAQDKQRSVSASGVNKRRQAMLDRVRKVKAAIAECSDIQKLAEQVSVDESTIYDDLSRDADGNLPRKARKTVSPRSGKS